MEKLIDTKQERFYRGTIIIMKDMEETPAGNFDIVYAMIEGVGKTFAMLDLYHGIGGVILHDLSPNVEGHIAVDKEGIRKWVSEYFELFYTKEEFKKYTKSDILDEMIYVDNLDNHFTQANRDLFMK